MTDSVKDNESGESRSSMPAPDRAGMPPASTADGSGPSMREVAEGLVEAGKLQQSGLDRALRVHGDTGEALAAVLSKLGLVPEVDLAAALAGALGAKLATTADFPDAPLLEDKLSMRFLRQARILPIQHDDDAIAIAMADPLDRFAIDAVGLATGMAIRVCVATPADIEAALDRLYGASHDQVHDVSGDIGGAEAEADVERLKDLASEAPVIRLVNLLIERAVEQRASDIHIEPFEGRLRVRYRIDGLLHEIDSPPDRLAPAIVSRIKIMARLNIAERRLPQDGRIKATVRGRELDLRVATIPTLYGESVVLRILDRDATVLDFAALGFDQEALDIYLKVLDMPYGIVLATGPTGSGKTTTLYTSLLRLNDSTRKILTIEDPVEYQLDGVVQVQVKPEIELTFGRALRSFLRHNPDILMIGEIRDLETAKIAVEMALTGHRVLSTLHTNDAASAVARLIDMGVPHYLLTATINGVVAQRLVRALCTECREAYEPSPEFLERLGGNGNQPKTLYRAVGCDKCGGTGYSGRTSLLEILVMDDALRRLVLQQADAKAIERAAIEGGMRSLYEDGLRKAAAGITTIEEVLGVTRAD